MLSFLTVNVDTELEILVVTSTVLDDTFTGIFIKGVVTGFVVVGLGLVADDPINGNDGFVLSVVVIVLFSCSGLVVVLVVVLVILVGFDLVVVESDGVDVVVLPSVVVLVVVVGLMVVILMFDVFVGVVVFSVVLGVVILAIFTV